MQKLCASLLPSPRGNRALITAAALAAYFGPDAAVVAPAAFRPVRTIPVGRTGSGDLVGFGEVFYGKQLAIPFNDADTN